MFSLIFVPDRHGQPNRFPKSPSGSHIFFTFVYSQCKCTLRAQYERPPYTGHSDLTLREISVALRVINPSIVQIIGYHKLNGTNLRLISGTMNQ